MNNIYKIKCKKCKQTTFHRIYKINRSKGIKLTCMSCGSISKFINLNDLRGKEVKI